MAESNSSAQGLGPAPEGTVSRVNIPFVMDLVRVSDPELIRYIESHPDVGRIHSVPTPAKPWWVQIYFPVTRFMDREDQMFVPLTCDEDPGYPRRMAYIEEKVKDGVKDEDVRTIALLLHTKASDENLTRAVVNAVNRRFYGDDVPDDVIEAAGKTANEIHEAVTSLYLPALKAQNKVLDFIGSNTQSLGGCPFADFSHHIGAAVQLLTPACKYLHKENREKKILDIFTQDDMPLTVQTPRIALEDTNLGGLLNSPAKKGWTVFVLNIREAAAKSKDSLFTFGAGVDRRQCAFRFAFQKLMADLQSELRRLEAADAAAAKHSEEVGGEIGVNGHPPSASQGHAGSGCCWQGA